MTDDQLNELLGRLDAAAVNGWLNEAAAAKAICYLRAGFEDEGKPTKVRNRISLRLRPEDMPEAEAPGDAQRTLWSAA